MKSEGEVHVAENRLRWQSRREKTPEVCDEHVLGTELVWNTCSIVDGKGGM